MKITLQNKSSYEKFIKTLEERESKLLSAFFADFSAHCLLQRREKEKLRADFENAVMYYASAGVSVNEALERLAVRHLGGFYSRPPIRWFPLDAAAKIYPLSIKKGQMAVFRISVYLKEPVIPELLQMALNFTIKRFPSFATTVKKGLFWHYLDASKHRYAVIPDSGLPCRPIKIASSGSQSFRVMYYKNRISIEFFHILTDGSGGTMFLKTLTACYLSLMGVKAQDNDDIFDIDDMPEESETINEFDRARISEKKSGFIDKPAVQMSGRLTRIHPFRLLHFIMNAPQLISAAGRHGATVTEYILANMFIAQRYATDEAVGEVSIQVPVNMRKFYPSDTLRNFSMYCGIRLELNEIKSIDEIIPLISKQLEEKASKKAMSEMMNSAKSLVATLQFVPLIIKAPVAGMVYGFLGDKIFSNTLSNLGIVTMPDEYSKHIESMDFSLGTAQTNRASCSLVTFGKAATLTISKMTVDPSFEEKLYELFTNDGIEIRVDGSEGYEG